MLFGKYEFLCRVIDDAQLPQFKGSTFRGVFGRALKKVVCALKTQECSQCLLKQRCVYALVFETPISTETAEGSRIAAQPHPFVIEPPLGTETCLSKGAPFNFHLLLFGDANRNLPYFIYAFEQIGQTGIGKRINGKRGRFTLEEVKTGTEPIYASMDQKLTIGEAFDSIFLKEPEHSPEDVSTLTVRMITPMRLKFNNRLKADLPFHVLVRAMLRRVSSLFESYGNGEPDMDYRGLVKRAMDVQVVDDNLSWYDWKRYSFRQDESMLMGGMVGAVTYEGNLGEYLPLIEFCEKVHLGKQTAFGLGKFEVEKA
jgi:CRISPR/Cas system endoribonuclease Cas6 (RAMP superfamily)